MESAFEWHEAYHFSNSPLATFVATTDEAASAPSGDKWWRLAGSFGVVAFQDFPAYVASPTIDYIVCRGLRIEGTLTAANKELVRFGEVAGDDLRIFRIRVSDSTFTLDVRGGGGTAGITIVAGTKVLNTSQTFTVRISADGTTVTLETDGTDDGSASSSKRVTTRGIQVFGTDESGVEHYFDTAGAFGCDTDADRPGYDVKAYFLDPNGDTSEDDYSDETDCSAGAAGAATYTKWDDYPGVTDEATTFNCVGARNAQQTSSLSSATPTDVSLVCGAVYRIWRRGTLDTKTVDNWARLIEGANVDEQQLVNIGHEGWRDSQHLFLTSPDDGAWTQAKIDALEAGHRVVDTNGAGAQVTALGVALIEVDDDPPAVAGDRRRSMGQVV